MRRRLRFLRQLGAAALLLAAGTAAAAPSDARGADGVIVGVQLEPPVLDPSANPAAAISETLYDNVYETLVQFAADGSVLPKLAQSWEVSADGLSYVFHLRDRVSFHNGSPFDAHSAKFSLDRARAQGSLNPQRARLEAIDEVRATDARTLELSLTHRAGGLLQSLAWGSFVMVEPRSASMNGTAPVGTGPYRFAEWRRGDSLTLTRNDDYWGTSAHLRRATFKFIADPTAAYAALMAGDIDAFSNYPAPENIPQFAADPRFKVLIGDTESETILGLNNRRPPLDERLVRQAIARALDRRAIIEGAMFGYGTPIGSHFAPHSPDYVDLTGQYAHDVSEGRRLLAQAGYAGGFTLTLKLPPPSYARRSGEIVAAELHEIGISVRIENLEWAQWLDQVFTRHDFDMTIVVHAEPMDYDIYARDEYYFGYTNPGFKALLAQLDDSIEPRRRHELLERIQRKLADDAVNGFLFEYPRLAVWNAHFHGLDFDNFLSVAALGGASDDRPAAPLEDYTCAAVSGVERIAGWAALAASALLLCLTARRFGIFFLGGRMVVLIATLATATAAIFLLVQVLPGDPARYMLGLQARPETVAALRHQLGLEAGPLERYTAWVVGLLRGDFGVSYTYRVPVRELIVERLRISLPLAIYALLLAVAVALPTGLAAAARRGRVTDTLLAGITQIGLAVPNFWLGMLLVLAFAVGLHWTSAGGFPGWGAGLAPALRALTLPAIALASPQAAILSRVLRGALIETLHEDFIRTARAKGASERRVLWRHALPNALIPVLTVLGMQFSFLLAGAVIIENVFFLPGLGRLVFQAIEQRDLIVVQSVVVLLVLAVVCVTFLTDLSYRLIDPRLSATRGIA